LIGISTTLAVLGSSRISATIRARSSGCVIASGGTSVTLRAMSVATKPGQMAVERTPFSQPAWRIACARPRAANLLMA
jgi:hypothetical protein